MKENDEKTVNSNFRKFKFFLYNMKRYNSSPFVRETFTFFSFKKSSVRILEISILVTNNSTDEISKKIIWKWEIEWNITASQVTKWKAQNILFVVQRENGIKISQNANVS